MPAAGANSNTWKLNIFNIPWRLTCLVFLAATLLVRQCGAHWPKWMEDWYRFGLFPVIRSILYSINSLFPFPLSFLFLPIVAGLVAWGVIHAWKSATMIAWKILNIVYTLVSWGALLVSLFLWMWGFHYTCPDFESHTGLSPTPLEISELQEEIDLATGQVVQLRSNYRDTLSLEDGNLPTGWQDTILLLVNKTVSSLGYPHWPLIRRTLPDGTLLHWGTAGMYFPFTGECNIDGGLHALQKPFTLAHECCHGLGFTDEGDCNFLALLACLKAENSFIRYSATLAWWRELAFQMRSLAPDQYQACRKRLPPGVQNDLVAIRNKMNSFRDWLPETRYRVYDTYLKVQGVQAGMHSYDRVIMLARAWRLRNELNPDNINN